MNLQEAIEMVEMFGVQDLPIPSNWVDTFNSGDAMYSFEVGSFRILIDTPNPKDSELYEEVYGEYNRFNICCSDDYRDENPNDHYGDDILYSTLDFDKALFWLESWKDFK